MASLDDYEIVSHVGKGSFGCITKIRRKYDDKVLVWKEIRYGGMSERNKNMLVREVNILRNFSHPNIVRYYNRIIDCDARKIFIIMEYCAGGDLAALIANYKSKRSFIDELFIWRVLSQLGSALMVCHSYGVLHRDVKPANIFLDEYGNAKLGDFGLSTRTYNADMHSSPVAALSAIHITDINNEGTMARSFVGTPYYMSPELVCDAQYGEKSDVWALGCLAYEMATLLPPFVAKSQAALEVKIRIGCYKQISSSFYSTTLSKALREMICVKQDERSSLDSIVEIARSFIERSDKLPQSPELTKPSTLVLGETPSRHSNFIADPVEHVVCSSKEDLSSSITSRSLALDLREAKLDEREQALERLEVAVDAKVYRAAQLLHELRNLSPRIRDVNALQQQEYQQQLPSYSNMKRRCYSAPFTTSKTQPCEVVKGFSPPTWQNKVLRPSNREEKLGSEITIGRNYDRLRSALHFEKSPRHMENIVSEL